MRRVLRGQRGLSLVEMMVGLFVGAMTLLAVFSLLRFVESARREVQGAAAAHEQATMALYDLQHALRHAGLGPFHGALACETVNVYHEPRVVADQAAVAAVRIRDGGLGSDELTVLYADTLTAEMPARLTRSMPTPSSVLWVDDVRHLPVGSLALVGTPGETLPCSLLQVTHVAATGSGDYQLQRNPGAGGAYNPANPAQVFSVAPRYAAGSLVVGLDKLHWRTYRQAGQQLQVRDEITGAQDELAQHVVGIKAQYGVSSTAGAVDTWTSAIGVWAAPVATQLAAVRAVRVAVVVRNPQALKPTAGTTCDATTEPRIALFGGTTTLDVSVLPAWRCHTYRAFELTVPLKNILLEGEVS